MNSQSRLTILVISAVATFCLPLPTSGAVVSLEPDADTWIGLGDNDDFFANHGSELTLELGRFSIFSDMGDQSALIFGTDYHLTGPLWLFLRARYSYERVDEDQDLAQRFLVQRRFEPLTGFRLRF